MQKVVTLASGSPVNEVNMGAQTESLMYRQPNPSDLELSSSENILLSSYVERLDALAHALDLKFSFSSRA